MGACMCVQDARPCVPVRWCHDAQTFAAAPCGSIISRVCALHLKDLCAPPWRNGQAVRPDCWPLHVLLQARLLLGSSLSLRAGGAARCVVHGAVTCAAPAPARTCCSPAGSAAAAAGGPSSGSLYHSPPSAAAAAPHASEWGRARRRAAQGLLPVPTPHALLLRLHASASTPSRSWRGRVLHLGATTHRGLVLHSPLQHLLAAVCSPHCCCAAASSMVMGVRARFAPRTRTRPQRQPLTHSCGCSGRVEAHS